MSTQRTLRLAEPKPIDGRPPPHDLDAEGSVLACLMLKPDTFEEVADLKRSDFYSEANGMIFEAIQDLVSKGAKVDAVTVASWLKDRERAAVTGGVKYLVTLLESSAAVWNLRAYGDIVARKAKRRQAIAIAQHIAAEGYWEIDGGSEDEWLAGLPARFEMPETSDSDAIHVGDAMQRVWTSRRDIGLGRVKLGPSTGLGELDRRIGGLRGGKVTTIAARSGIGKTALAFQAATTVAANGDAVLIFELEAPEEECVDRLHYATAGVDGSKLLQNIKLPDAELRALTAAAEKMARSELWMVTKSTFTATQIRAAAKRAHRSYEKSAKAAIDAAKAKGIPESQWPNPPRLRLIVVDYLQLVSTSDVRGGNSNREAQVSHVSREMKRLAMDLDVHVMVLSQLNKDGDRRGEDVRPRTSDMRESSAIENDSDHIILIYNPHALQRSRGERTELFDDVELILGKNRGGKPGTIRVQWWPSQQSYRCIEQSAW